MSKDITICPDQHLMVHSLGKSSIMVEVPGKVYQIVLQTPKMFNKLHVFEKKEKING